ncbi:MAG: ABC transporter permease, partial [Bacteroidia bacterium]
MLKKIAQNRLGLFGLIFITLLLIVAVLGYLITPDATPLANDIHLEISLQKPGFEVDMLRIEKGDEQDVSIISKLIQG